MPDFELHRPQEADKRRRFVSMLLSLVLSIAANAARARTALGSPPQSSKGTIRGVVTVLSQQAEPSPLEGVSVELRESSRDSQPLATLTDSAGHYEFTQLPGATYILRISQQGFKPFAETISLNANQTSVVDIALTLDSIAEKVEVKEQAASALIENSSPASTVSNAQLETLPLAQQKFRDALPLVPGVIRSLDGKLTVRGTSENQGMLEVDSAKTVDPVTGSFSIPVPIDAIQTVNVDKTPFSAENGGFSGGLTRIETIPPPSDWFYKVKDFNVSLRGKNGRFVGVSQATPRVSFGGPVSGGKVSFSEVFEYDVRRDPVRGLAWPNNEIKTQGFNSFTRVQAILSPQITTRKASRQASRTFIASTRAHCLGLLCATHGLIATPMVRDRRRCSSIRRAGAGIFLTPGPELPTSSKHIQHFSLRPKSGLADMS